MEINLLPFLVEALGYNSLIYKDIDNLYQKDKFRFYGAAKNSEYYNHQIISEGSLMQEEYCRKALGILICMQEDNGMYDEFETIISKGWPYAYIYVINNNKIDLDVFMKKYIKKNKNIDNVTDDELNTILVIAVFTALCSGKEIVNSNMYTTFLEVLDNRLSYYNKLPIIQNGNQIYNTVNNYSVSSDNIIPIRELRDTIYTKFGIIKDYNSLLLKRNLKHKYIERLTFLFDFEKLSPSLLQDINFDMKDIDEILFSYVVPLINTENLIENVANAKENISEAANYLIAGIFIKSLIKIYKDVKKTYFENNKETMFVEIESKQKEIDDVKVELKVKDEELTKAQEMLQEKDKEIKRLKMQLEDNRLNFQELKSLRNFMFNMDNKLKFEDVKPDMSQVNKLQGLFFGGSEKFQRRMKELIPNFSFISPNVNNFDTNIINNSDIIFIYTDYLSHAQYYKIMANSKGKEITYLQANINEKIVLQEILNAIKK